jgi:hypothetical protein
MVIAEGKKAFDTKEKGRERAVGYLSIVNIIVESPMKYLRYKYLMLLYLRKLSLSLSLL